MNKPSRWSYSSISTYESCPRKWYYSYVENMPYKASAAMERGTRLHSYCEDWMNGKIPVIPWELTKVSLRLQDFKTKGGIAEQTWTLDQNWVPQDPAWVKAIVDLHWVADDVLHLRDYKSGREYPDHREQLELYAVIGMIVYPHVKRAEYAALYLDTAHESNEGSVLRGAMLDSKRESWHNRAIKIFEDDTYDPKPGGGCKWCDYSIKKGGPCKDGK